MTPSKAQQCERPEHKQCNPKPDAPKPKHLNLSCHSPKHPDLDLRGPYELAEGSDLRKTKAVDLRVFPWFRVEGSSKV